jgi:hypothetical protein
MYVEAKSYDAIREYGRFMYCAVLVEFHSYSQQVTILFKSGSFAHSPVVCFLLVSIFGTAKRQCLSATTDDIFLNVIIAVCVQAIILIYNFSISCMLHCIMTQFVLLPIPQWPLARWGFT